MKDSKPNSTKGGRMDVVESLVGRAIRAGAPLRALLARRDLAHANLTSGRGLSLDDGECSLQLGLAATRLSPPRGAWTARLPAQSLSPPSDVQPARPPTSSPTKISVWGGGHRVHGQPRARLRGPAPGGGGGRGRPRGGDMGAVVPLAGPGAGLGESPQPGYTDPWAGKGTPTSCIGKGKRTWWWESSTLPVG